MHTFGIVVNVLALWGCALYLSFSFVGWLARRPRITGRVRRPRGLPSLAASPTPNLATTFTTRRTRQVEGSSSSSTALGSVSVDTETLLRLAARSRLTERGSSGRVTETRGENGGLNRTSDGAPRGDAA